MFWIIGGIIAVGVAMLCGALIRFNLKQMHVRKCAQRASNAQIEGIYERLGAAGSEPPNGFILARTNRTAEDLPNLIRIPDGLADFPWSGQTVSVNAMKEPEFTFAADQSMETRLLGRAYEAVAVPRFTSKSGKLRNNYQPTKYLASDPVLAERVKSVCPEYPLELLSYLLAAGGDTFEFDAINQARIGTSAAWLQEPEFQSCPKCKKRMTLIIQLPGTLAHRKHFQNGTFFFFGCPAHPEETSVVSQFT